MTAQELRHYFNEMYGMHTPWPETHEVDAETYANCCQYVFDDMYDENFIHVPIALGKNQGLIFKNVELIYEPK